MKHLLKLTAAGVAAMTLMAGSAFANTVTLGGAAEIECNDDNDATVGCLGMTGGSLTTSMNMVTGGTAGTLDNTSPFTADVYSIGSNSEANEIAALNVLAGTSFTAADANRVMAGDVSSDGGMTASFTTLAEWVILKVGAGTIFIQNTTGGAMALNIDFSQIGMAGGLSHYTEVGQIPIPGALWLMGAGLAGLGFASRRKKAA